jgi:hypothetical protein
MSESKFSRRSLLGVGLGAASATLLPSTAVKLAHADDFGPNLASQFNGDIKTLMASVTDAYAFLDQMIDAYATGTTTRLTQSYADQIGLQSSGSRKL